MQDIPARAKTVVAALAWVMVPEPFDGIIPDRSKAGNHQVLYKRNPNVLDHQEAAEEVVDG